MANIVYIATSLDGYIADKNNDLDWLHQVPNPDGSDFGFAEFMDSIDALVMGRNTMEKVLSFGIDWPYNKPVYVLSSKLTQAPEGLEDKIFPVKGTPEEITATLKEKGLNNLYIDGGKTVQSFLQEDLIDKLVITTIPILLGGGIPLFSDLEQPLQFKLEKSETLNDLLVKNTFTRSDYA
ncbi:dihydrofolate reductase homolog [Vibrio ishigakensis]|uniref:Dihydrofolate reductase homolog n=1 Tax=Vibrio ishigakensis TaxID=1481914 RepID=A0A0B8NRX5_9VIBR|nr:dihydrofolate reductase family protein [Vibrio ishigakensis]GAM55067.1 dihydrofolate reductase homolog [Vibrio ishigakensis]